MEVFLSFTLGYIMGAGLISFLWCLLNIKLTNRK